MENKFHFYPSQFHGALLEKTPKKRPFAKDGAERWGRKLTPKLKELSGARRRRKTAA